MATEKQHTGLGDTSVGFTPWEAKSEEGHEMSLADFYKVILHQKPWFLGIAAAILVIGTVLITLMPKMYIASSSILLEREGIYSEKGGASSQDTLTLRMHGIIKTILSTDSVISILKSHDIVDDNASRAELNGYIGSFRNAAKFEFDNVSVLREASGREGLYSMGLSVSYESTSPDLSFEMTKELTDRLLGNNAGKMSAENQIRMDYLNQNLSEVKLELDLADDELTRFKEENSLSLPEMQDIAIRRIDSLGLRMLQSQDRLKVLQSRGDEAQAQLSSIALDSSVYSTDGKRIASVEDQLSILRLDYAATKDKYSPTHPDRVAMEEKIASLQALAGGGGVDEIELKVAKQKLSSLKQRYSPQHPDVSAMEEQVAVLSAQVKSRGKNSRRKSAAANNPVYSAAQARIRGVRTEVELERQTTINLQEEMLDVEERIKAMPKVESLLRRLVSSRDSIEKRYKSVETEIEGLRSSSGMREAELFEKFVLLESPDVPLAPSKPNKGVLFPVLFVLALGLAYLFVFIRHFIRGKILSSEDVERVTDLPVYLIPDFS